MSPIMLDIVLSLAAALVGSGVTLVGVAVTHRDADATHDDQQDANAIAALQATVEGLKALDDSHTKQISELNQTVGELRVRVSSSERRVAQLAAWGRQMVGWGKTMLGLVPDPQVAPPMPTPPRGLTGVEH